MTLMDALDFDAAFTALGVTGMVLSLTTDLGYLWIIIGFLALLAIAGLGMGFERYLRWRAERARQKAWECRCGGSLGVMVILFVAVWILAAHIIA